MDVDDTIVAIASPTSPAPRGIVRLSGNDAIEILRRLGIPCGDALRSHRLDTSIDIGEPIGRIPASVMLWPTSRSYTGQPSAELHTIGSLPLLTGLTETVIAAGGRAARPGEFTMRAFLAGRLDLTQAEAVLGVIEAQGRGSLDHALAQLAGNLSKPLEKLRNLLLDLLADVEAGLDFVDEDIEFISDDVLVARLSEVQDVLRKTAGKMRQRGGGAARPVVALRGQPNAGKSCLVNRLSGRQVAIVAEVAGTTRDTVHTDILISGQPVTLIDTAGIETLDSQVSRLSQAQARQAGEQARVRLWCVDCNRDDFTAACDHVRRQAESSGRANVVDLWVATKQDLRQAADPLATHDSEEHSVENDDWIHCSAQTGHGIELLRERIALALSSQDGEEVGSVVGTTARCSQSLAQAQQAIEAAITLTSNQGGHEFVSAEIRTAVDSLGEVTGAVYTDDILDRVFGRFCIGK